MLTSKQQVNELWLDFTWTSQDLQKADLKLFGVLGSGMFSERTAKDHPNTSARP